MNSICDDSGITSIVVHEVMEGIIEQANSIRIQNEEKKQIYDAAIHYALKECEYFLCLRLIFHDIENCQYKLTDEDQEPQPMKTDNMQCFSIAKRKRIQSQNQDELAQNSLQLNESQANDQQESLTAQQIMNIMNNKQGFGIFLTPIKDRSYVRSLIAKEKMKNMSYQDVLNNSITYYGKEGLDKKATNLFNKYVKGHSLGPLKIEQSISPLRTQPKELQLPKNVAFERSYPQDIVEQLEEKVKIENLNLDTRKISLDVSQLDYSKIKLPPQKTEPNNNESLLHVPTYQSLFQQNIMKYDNSQLTLPTQITSSQPHITLNPANINSLQTPSIFRNNEEGNHNASIQSIQPIQEKFYIPQQYRQPMYNLNSNSNNTYIQQSYQQAKMIRASSTIKNNTNNNDTFGNVVKNKLRNVGRSFEKNSMSVLQDNSPVKQNYSVQGGRHYQLDQSFDHQQEGGGNFSIQQRMRKNSTEAGGGEQETILNDLDMNFNNDNNESNAQQSNLDGYKKQKVMRKELSQLLLERKKQQKYTTQIKNNNDKNKITMFAPERYSTSRNRSQASPLQAKIINSSQQIKEVLNTSSNYNINSDYLYQPSILSKPSYNNNHLKYPNYLPPLKTQRLSYNQ